MRKLRALVCGNWKLAASLLLNIVLVAAVGAYGAHKLLGTSGGRTCDHVISRTILRPRRTRQEKRG